MSMSKSIPPSIYDSKDFIERIAMLNKAGAYAVLYYDDIRNLEGKLLTILDASTTDVQHRKALKDLVRQTIWWHWAPILEHDPKSASGGMPEEASN